MTTADEIEKLIGFEFRLSKDQNIDRRVERQRATALWEPAAVDLKRRRLILSGCKS